MEDIDDDSADIPSSNRSGLQQERNFVDQVIQQNDLIRSAPRRQRQETASSDEGNIDAPSDEVFTESYDEAEIDPSDRMSHNISSFHQDISRTGKTKKVAAAAVSRRKSQHSFTGPSTGKK